MKNQQSDLTNPTRNSFGFKYPNNHAIIGTKGDVLTFFLVLNDLISQRILENEYETLSHDLYRTMVNYRNVERFEIEKDKLKTTFTTLDSGLVDWEKYPYNRKSVSLIISNQK